MVDLRHGTRDGRLIVNADLSVPGRPQVYAIGDIVDTPWLAHVASHEGIVCVEMIAYAEEKHDTKPHPINYNNVPGCTYCQPQIASVGYTEEQAKEAGYEVSEAALERGAFLRPLRLCVGFKSNDRNKRLRAA